MNLSNEQLANEQLAWAVRDDLVAERSDRNGAFHYWNPRRLGPFEFWRDHEQRSELVNTWLRETYNARRAALGWEPLNVA